MNNHDFSAVFAFAFIALGLSGFARASEPPKAKKIPHKIEANGQVRVDDYYWLKDRKDPDVIAYLKAENAYADAVLKPAAPLQHALFAEMKSHHCCANIIILNFTP